MKTNLLFLTLFFISMPLQLLPAQAPAVPQMSRRQTKIMQTFQVASSSCAATCCIYSCCCCLCNQPVVSCALGGWAYGCLQINKLYQERAHARKIQEDLQNLVIQLEQELLERQNNRFR